MTIAEIRALYPHPMPATGHAAHLIPGSYCVGGSLCLALAQAHHHTRQPMDSWPAYRYLASVLQAYNHALDDAAAYEYAWKIITDNDHDMIESAWNLAEQALTYHPEKD